MRRLRSIVAVLFVTILLSGCFTTRQGPDYPAPKLKFLVHIPGQELIEPSPGETIDLGYKETAEITLIASNAMTSTGIGNTTLTIGMPSVCAGEGGLLKGQTVSGEASLNVKILSTKIKPEGLKCDKGYLLSIPALLRKVYIDLSLLVDTQLVVTATSEAHWPAPPLKSSFVFNLQTKHLK